MLLSFVSSFGQTFFIAVFAGEIMRDFALTDGQWGLIYTVATSCSALAMIWAGALTDRLRVRHLGICTALLLATACLVMAGARSAAVLVVAIFLLRFAGQGMMSHLSAVSMARWFVANRGKALSVASMGVALGQALLPVLFVAAMAWVDWRALWLAAAGAVVILLPLLVRLLRSERTPRSMVVETEAEGMGGRHWTRPEILRHWLFWAMVPLLLGPPAFGTALFFHQVHLTLVKGWALVDYVALLPLFTVLAIGTTFASGALLDRIGSPRPMQVFLLPFALGFATMAGAQSLWGAALAIAFFGIGTGAQATIPSAFWAEFFGTRYLGAIKALAAAIMVLGTALGPGLTGALIDAGLTLPEQMPAIAVYFLLAGGLAAAAIGRARRDLAAPQIDVVRA
ncbi:MFS transporter [Jannaschia sp. S6380]|nr:MFS transporter [Jannaschia sp. S6380]MCK0168431.1 MFS transporter [Jannaschia sp. S6380]